jgi:hypothetical protein
VEDSKHKVFLGWKFSHGSTPTTYGSESAAEAALAGIAHFGEFRFLEQRILFPVFLNIPLPAFLHIPLAVFLTIPLLNR